MPPKKKQVAKDDNISAPPAHLQQVRSFDKSRLKRTDVHKVYHIRSSVKLGPIDLCYKFWDGNSYPVHQIQAIIDQISEGDEVTLDFGGVAALTDTVFAVMGNLRNTNTARFDSVEIVVLDGCYLITDAGLTWMGEAFPNIAEISMVGCCKITDAGIISLSKLCRELDDVDLSSTSVSFLPRAWSGAVSMKVRTSGCPLLSSAAQTDVKSDDKGKLIKVCILTREKKPRSVLAAIIGENEPSKVTWPKVQPQVELQNNITATIIEADQSLAGLLVTSHSIVVIPCEVLDGPKLSEEVASISALILTILGKFPTTHFLIGGWSTETPTVSKLKDLEAYLNKLADFIKDTKLANFITDTKLANFITDTKLADFITDTKLADFIKDTKFADSITDAKLADSIMHTKLADFIKDTKFADFIKDTKLADSITDTKLADFITDTKLADLIKDTKLADFITNTKLADFIKDTKLADSIMDTKLADFIKDTKLADFIMDTNLADFIKDTKLADSITETKLADFIKDIKLADFIKDTKFADFIMDTIYSIWLQMPMSIAKQLEYSMAQQLCQSINTVHMAEVMINPEKPESVFGLEQMTFPIFSLICFHASKKQMREKIGKVICFFDEDTVLKELAKLAESLDIVNDTCYSKQIYTWAKEFHSKCPGVLQSGIHTLNEAAHILGRDSVFKHQSEAIGAVQFLANIGKLTLWKNVKGESQVANTTWLCECLRTLLSPAQEGISNNGLNHTIADEAIIWSVETLQEDIKSNRLDWSQIQRILREFSYLWLSTSNSFTPFACLPDKPSMYTKIFTEFDKRLDEDGVHIIYSFTVKYNVTPAVLQQILASVLQLHKPIHVWKTGVIIYDSIVAIMIGQTGDNKTLLHLCAYMTSSPKDDTDISDSNARLIYSTVEKYRIVITYVLISNGIIWEQVVTVSDSIKQIPEGTTGVVHSHALSTNNPGVCALCGTTSAQSSMLTAMEMILDPAFLNSDNVKYQDLNGSIISSLIELLGPSELSLSAYLDPMGCHQFSIVLIKAKFQSFKISLISPEKYCVTIDLTEKRITTEVEMETKIFDISKHLNSISLDGEIITAKVNDNDSFQIDIYLGLILIQTVPVPYSSYGLTISTECVPYHGPVFTVHSSNLKARVVGIQEGMRLEAMDRLNPHLTCVATIEKINHETGKVLIHFDGWTQRYSYWAEFGHRHLHPIGYMHYRGKKLQEDYNMTSDLQAPYGYVKDFDWLTYLTEVGAEPVPYSFFNEKQTEGIPDDIISAIQKKCGSVFPMSEQAKYLSCQQHSYCRAEFIERQAQIYAAKFEDGNQDTEEELIINKHCVCLLPPSLSVELLRFPPLESVFSDKQQNLHFLCPGQVLDIHHVNHPGLSTGPNLLKPWLKGLFAIYGHLMAQKHVLPHTKSDFCIGAEKVSENQWHYLEAALKRLYKLYLMHCVFYWTQPMGLITEQNEVIDSMLETAFKSDDHTFAQQFSYLPGTTSILCHAHKLANSPSAGLLEISLDKFQSLASSIYTVHLENNRLSSLPADFFSSFVNLTHLWLNECSISELPTFQKNTCLEEIHIKGNVLTTLPDDMGQLISLRILDISNNPFGVLPSVISSLGNLTELYADNVGIVDLTVICPLKKLTKLSVGQNYIDDIPDHFSLLPLAVLDMAGLPLMPAGTAFSIHSVNKHLDQFTVCRRMSVKERQEIIERVDSTCTHKNSSEKVSEFNKILIEKYPRLGNMAAQKDSNFPEAILNITTLERLAVPYHAFKSVPDSVKNLTHLEYLNVGYNPCLETVSAQLATLPIKELHLKDCGNLKTPPREVVRRGFLAVFGFLKRLLQGSVSCRRTKLMMVGLGGAGKTSLAKALTCEGHQYYQDYGEMITDGINISEWVVPIVEPDGGDSSEESSDVLHFSVWDFAGQTVYYNTHQFFLSNRAVYLLLWNIRLGFEHAGLDFWLSSVACHAPKAPIFVVGSHCDKVQKGKLPTEELRRRFPQIAGFHFISSYTREGISELKEEIIKTALSQKYMGEMIPEAWLGLETKLDNVRRTEEKALLPWSEIEELAGSAGIFDHIELVQAVQFLHDLGSVQFFNTNFLRSYVVITPQWIIDVMACIVTVNEGPTKDGKLLYSDMAVVWQKYPEELHPWLLRLTEEFDLTFPLSSEEANIVPCLLSNTEPKFEYPPADKEDSERETRLLYKFEYLPAGLFNRAQVRLHEFSDSSVMWKKGVLLRKNNHRALLLQISNTEVMVTARGYKPENILFMVHEVFECLIADAYSGVSYDYSIPCVECLAEFALDPCMFPASKIKRASDMKVPFLQCDKYFHIISIPEIQAIMPPDNTADYDKHLANSVRELQHLETEMGIQILFIYTRHNIPNLANVDKVVDPTQVLDDLRSAGCNISYCDNPETVNMESMTVSLKSAQIVILGISEEFVSCAQCRNLVIYIKKTLHKAIIVLALGKTMNWQETDINFILGDEVFVKMTQLSRYESKLSELLDTIKTRSQKKKVVYPECFISYSWANSKTAVELGSATVDGAIGWGDPRKIKKFLQSKGVNCWLDVEQMGQEGFFEDIADGLRKAKVMIACVSDEYANSGNCKMEFRFAVSNLKIPTILAVVGTGYIWERSEIGLLTVGHSLMCPKINLQYEHEARLLDLLKEVQRFLPQSADVRAADASADITLKQCVAFQEALELAQRKMLRHIILYSGTMDFEAYPRLIMIDLKTNSDSLKSKTEQMKTKTRDETAARNKNDIKNKNDLEQVNNDSESGGRCNKYCFRLLCESDQGWHESPVAIDFQKMEMAAEEEFLRSVSPYTARMLAILKHSKINLPILTSSEGEQLCKQIEEWCPRATPDFQDQYKMIVQVVLEEDKERTYGGLKRCHRPNGKILWLCEKHENSYKNNDTYHDKQQSQESETTAEMTNRDTEADSIDEIPQEVPEDISQLPVKLVQPRGQVLPRKPRLNRGSSVNRKTTSQACSVM